MGKQSYKHSDAVRFGELPRVERKRQRQRQCFALGALGVRFA
jgi:hypothetical protein